MKETIEYECENCGDIYFTIEITDEVENKIFIKCRDCKEITRIKLGGKNMSISVWFLIQKNDKNGKKILEVDRNKKPLMRIKNENYSDSDNVVVEERVLSINQDLSYFGYLLDNVSFNLSYYLDSFIRDSDIESLTNKEDVHKWVIKSMIKMKTEISRLSHMISQNNLVDSSTLEEQMSTPRFKDQNIHNVRCGNNKCKYWIQSHGNGLCKEANPRLNIYGTCITMELEI